MNIHALTFSRSCSCTCITVTCSLLSSPSLLNKLQASGTDCSPVMATWGESLAVLISAAGSIHLGSALIDALHWPLRHHPVIAPPSFLPLLHPEHFLPAVRPSTGSQPTCGMCWNGLRRLCEGLNTLGHHGNGTLTRQQINHFLVVCLCLKYYW